MTNIMGETSPSATEHRAGSKVAGALIGLYLGAVVGAAVGEHSPVVNSWKELAIAVGAGALSGAATGIGIASDRARNLFRRPT